MLNVFKSKQKWLPIILVSILGAPLLASGEPVIDDAQVVQQYRKAAEQGDAYFQFRLGNMYLDGDGTGVSKDASQAALWYRKAAKQGMADAQNDLGTLYANGTGVSKNEAQAALWYRKAADQGLADAQRNLGVMYENGIGVSKDAAQAVLWYRKAADQGNAHAQNNLGAMYANGTGVSKDEAQAALWFRKAADQGFAEAQFNLGSMYINGTGVSKDEAQAALWYRKAADQGLANAQFNLGSMYINGTGVSKDAAQAVLWYRKAADQGFANAQINLGVMYEKGIGVSKDAAQAAHWFRKAADQGNASAVKNLEALRKAGRNGGDVQVDIHTLMMQAKEAFAAKKYEEAIIAYNKVLMLPPSASHQIAQEWIGVANELSGQVDKAKVEYNLYLKLYPNSEGVTRVEERLTKLSIRRPGIQRYVIYEGKTEVADTKTALIWRRCAEGMTFNDGTCTGKARGFTYEEALRHAKDETARTGVVWRVPEKDELASLVDKEFMPTINSIVFPTTPKYPFWSTSPDVGGSAEAWVVNFGNGIAGSEYRRYGGVSVRLVRTFGMNVHPSTSAATPTTRQAAKPVVSGMALADSFEESFEKAFAAMDNNDYTTAFTELEPWAKQGRREAQYALGKLYERGLIDVGGQINPVEAAKWYRKAAEQGVVNAQHDLGVMYVRGAGVRENPVEAARWFRSAAEQGFADAQYWLGMCYAEGKGVKKNSAAAVKWFRKAADQGHEGAQSVLEDN